MKVTHKVFIAAWRSSSSPAEVAEKTGLTADSAKVKASMLRKSGVKLKKFSRTAWRNK